jgi:hypothetical protein
MTRRWWLSLSFAGLGLAKLGALLGRGRVQEAPPPEGARDEARLRVPNFTRYLSCDGCWMTYPIVDVMAHYYYEWQWHDGSASAHCPCCGRTGSMTMLDQPLPGEYWWSINPDEIRPIGFDERGIEYLWQMPPHVVARIRDGMPMELAQSTLAMIDAACRHDGQVVLPPGSLRLG